MRLKVEHLSKDRDAPPVWWWSSKTGVTADDVDHFWQAFLRRFDLEDTSAARSRRGAFDPARSDMSRHAHARPRERAIVLRELLAKDSPGSRCWHWPAWSMRGRWTRRCARRSRIGPPN
jgi:hypothetical protein